ncbi:hypothetical protein [Virgibacillus sp. CBA3643]|uniref:TOTE conflict system archaeo-eukaryotic primase domain-containing protein n=1 Tax=Virgibacillus sp. CBA3643 TaxID=2942278 RepID=UPI0035A27E42
MDNNLWQQLSDMKWKYDRLEQENQRLKELLRKNQIPFEQNLQEQSFKSQEVTRRIDIFNNLFKGRTDVYARRRENPNNPNGKASYYPVRDGVNSTNDYEQSESNQVKKAYKPLTNQTIYNHLSGEQVVGIYPLLHGNTCWFLALDFDKENWKKESKAIISICHHYHIPAAMERSRSGDGCHIWIFFSEKVPAAGARNLGNFLMKETLKRNHWMQLKSFDRMFPAQDRLKGKGFGNLIALPLQKKARAEGNSVFIDQNMMLFLINGVS